MFLCLTLVSVCLALTLAQDTDLQYSLPEEKPVGTFVANIASDGRLLINVTDAVFNQLRYQLLTEGNMYAKLFTMNEQTGQLETAEKIDRESVCQGLVVCNLGLFVNVFKDDPDFPNNPVLIKYLRIHVMLQDINDHEPVFPNPEVVVSVSEIVNTGYVIPISAATDQDSGANNSVRTYEFVNLQDVFQLKVQTDLNSVLTLEIEVIKNLDYEMVKYYQLEILAKDGGIPQKSGNVTVHINVLDENDNFPMFTKSEYTATTIENQKLGVVIVQVTATDIDSGNKGNVSYRFNPSSVPSAFGINATTGEIYVAGEIDYETDDSFSFFVQAVDQGAQPRISSTVVLINVTDVNDNAPQVSINLPPGGDMISEATEAGSYIANVAVSDPDSGAFGNITCHLQSEFFRMETLYINMYKVILNKSLDRESRPVHNVSVLCADGGSPNLVTMSSFLISVGDVNDNQPTFTFDLYNVSLYENNAIGTPITIVTAVDKDQGENGRLTYSLHDDVDGLFSINSNSGVISANVVFDRETRTQVQFRVVATDNNAVTQLSSTATIVVMIIDKNDNKPSFSQQLYSFNIPENQVAGTVIGRVYVYDKDIGANGQIHFTQSHPYTSIFEVIQSTGQIQTKIVLDREIQGVYDFKLTALDNGVPALQTTTHVVIVIEDVNDNVPNVTFPSAHNNTVAITPGKSQGALVTKVMASDPDLGANSHLTYLVIKGGAGLFQVDNRTGVVVTERALTQDHIGTYTLLLAIQDGGTPSQTTWSNLVILVADDDANQNMIIVIAVVSVTVTLSIGMIIMICLIRRQDGHKHHPDQSTFTEHKKKFILEWLHCLSTSTHDVQKLGTDKADTQIHRPTDLKPIMISSKDSTTTEGSHDGTNVSTKVMVVSHVSMETIVHLLYSGPNQVMLNGCGLLVKKSYEDEGY